MNPNPLGSSPVSLKDLAKHLQLSPATLSLVLNNSPRAKSVPQETKDRIFAAAREFNYRPNFLGRSLRSQRTYTIGVLIPEMSDSYSSLVVAGIEEHLMQAGYMYFVSSHHHKEKLLLEYPQMMRDRRVEGLIAVDTPYEPDMPLPVVAVSGHRKVPGVARIVLNHRMAAELALEHLKNLGHKHIGVIRGQDFSADTKIRWDSIRTAAARFDLEIHPDHVGQLDGDDPSPQTGYVAAQPLIRSPEPFTAVFAFNDVSAIGVIRALRETGRRVPEDVSVVGFDDVPAAAFHIPALTTIRQPLRRMGALAAQALIERIANPEAATREEIRVDPALIVRESTGPCPAPPGSSQTA